MRGAAWSMETTVRPEPVEGLRFLSGTGEGMGFDKLSPNGVGAMAR